jgi:O-antigen ligase
LHGMTWAQNVRNTSAIPVLIGFLVALLTVVLGPIALLIALCAVIIVLLSLRDAFRLFIWLIIMWPVLTLYVRYPLPAGMPDLSFDRVMVVLLFVAVVLEAVRDKRRLMKITVLDIMIVLYAFVQLSSRLYVLWFGGMGSPNLHEYLDAVIVPLIMYWIAKNLIVSRVHREYLLYALVVASFLVCLSGLYERSVGLKVFNEPISLGGSGLEYEWQDLNGLRASGLLLNPAIYGAVVGIGALAGICCLTHAKGKITRVALLATIGVLLYGVLCSYTRSAWISVFLVLFMAQFFMGGLWKRTLPILTIALLFIALIWNSIPTRSVITARATNKGTVATRLDLWEIGWGLFMERPLLGWGSDALNAYCRRAIDETSHNIYLTYLVDGGMVLFLSFSVTIAYILVRAIRVYRLAERYSYESNFLLVMVGGVMIYLLSGVALELRYFGYFNVLFWICVGGIDGLGVWSKWVQYPH